MSYPEKKKKDPKRMFIRITCFVLALSMVATTIFVIFAYLTGMYS